MCDCNSNEEKVKPERKRYRVEIPPYGDFTIEPQSYASVTVRSCGHVHVGKRGMVEVSAYFERVGTTDVWRVPDWYEEYDEKGWIFKQTGILSSDDAKTLVRRIERAVGEWAKEHRDALLLAAYQNAPWQGARKKAREIGASLDGDHNARSHAGGILATPCRWPR